MAARLYRGPLPTLTEDDVREQGERATLPPPIPIGDIVAGMMERDRSITPDGTASVSDEPRPEVEHRELPPVEAERVIREVEGAYLTQLGGGRALPFVRKNPVGVRRAPLDHRAGFVMSLIDGASSVEDIVDLSSMPRVECLRTLCDLRDLGVIDVRSRR